MSESHIPDRTARTALLMIKLAGARADVQTVMKTEDADMGTYQITYANIGATMAAVDKACAANGLAWVQATNVTSDDRWTLDTLVIDTDTGHYRQFSGPPGTIKGDPQAMGGMLTYYRRYALTVLFGLNTEDDDGQQAKRAHHHETTGNPRSPAEDEVVKIVKGLGTKEERDDFKADFREEFGTGMSDLPESRHGDALGWAKWYVNPDVGPADAPEPDEAADAVIDGEAPVGDVR